MASTAPTTTTNESARRYATNELLELRTSLPFVTLAIKKLNQHPGLDCILRIPDAARKDPERFSCKTSMLVEITNGIAGHQAERRRALESSRESEHQSLPDAPGKQASGQLHQWAFRRRDSSDRSSQPHSAPAGTTAQRSENFQKFYRAVVSPTHVRVTAGGRIVPNTRATAPPPLEWNNENSSFDPTKQTYISGTNSPQSVPWQVNTASAPLFPNTFVSACNLLPQGTSLSNMPPPRLYPLNPGSDHGSVNQGPASHLHADAGINSAQPGLIKISPPTQFDQSRPFMYNGQWIYPVSAPPGTVPVPVSMLGNAGYFPSPSMPPAGFIQQPFSMSVGNMSNPMMFPAGQHAPMIISGAGHASEGIPSISPLMPIPGMVYNPEALRSHVSGMRFQLRNLEDQISNSNGQGDQLFMEHQRTFLLSQINNMEAMMERQRSHSVRGSNGKGNAGNANLPQVYSKPTGTTQAAELEAQQPAVVSSSMVTSKKVEFNDGMHLSPDNNGTKPRSEQATKSRLSMAAALAPPFQPRSKAVVENSNQGITGFPSPSPDYIEMIDNNPQMKAEIEARLKASAMQDSNWQSSVCHSDYLTLSDGPPVLAKQVTKPAQPPSMQRSTTTNGSTSIAPEGNPVVPPSSVPYLVGTLPTGLQPSLAKATDFMYSRPLTDEEIRARYLYWGKAPRSVQSGLPKFDGKDFYPASPVKQKVDLAANVPEGAAVPVQVPRRVTTPANNQNPSFEHLFASPWTPSYKSPSPPPGVAKNGWPTRGSIPAQPIFTNGSHFSRAEGPSYSTRMAASMNSTSVGVGLVPIAEASRSRYPSPNSGMNLTKAGNEDFSSLFTEDGAAGYKSQPPMKDEIKETVVYYNKSKLDGYGLITPQNRDSSENEGGDDEMGTQGSWEHAGSGRQLTPDATEGGQSGSADSVVTSSTVEFNLGPQTYEERVDNFRSAEQQTLFLQNMLKKEASVGAALSGTISSATAQGYLPQYRGSAAASLAPSVMNLQHTDSDSSEVTGPKRDVKRFPVAAPVMATSPLPENRPYTSERVPRAASHPDAESYTRYLATKDENSKQIIEHGWNSNTTGRGPISGSDW